MDYVSIMVWNIWRKLYWYCNWYFWDSYRDKRIEWEWFDWLVAREDNWNIVTAIFINSKQKNNLVEEWSKEQQEE